MPASTRRVATHSAKKHTTQAAKKGLKQPAKKAPTQPEKSAKSPKTRATVVARIRAAPRNSALMQNSAVEARSSLGKANAQKRAASQGSPGTASKRRSKVTPSCLGQSSRPNTCDLILSALKGVEELSPKVRQVLGGLVGIALGGDDGMLEPYREAAITMVREALLSVDRKLKRELEEAQTKVDQLRAEEEDQRFDLQNAETRVVELKKMIAETKTNIKESTNAIHTSQHGLVSVTATQKASQCKLNETASKVEQLRSLDQDLYQPLKSLGVQGPHGSKQLRKIGRVGKDIGFQEAVLKTVPRVLKKELDKRRTVDGLVLDEMESEFSKHYAELESMLNSEQAVFEDCKATVQDAQEVLNDAVQTRNAHMKALAEAEARCSKTSGVLTKAWQHTRRFQSMIEKSVKELSLAEARLDAFRTGPLAAFQNLQLVEALPMHSASEPEQATNPGLKSVSTQLAIIDPALECPAPKQVADAVPAPKCSASMAISEPTAGCNASSIWSGKEQKLVDQASTQPPGALVFSADAVEAPATLAVEDDATLATTEARVSFSADATEAQSTIAGDNDATLAWAPTEILLD